MKKFISLIAVVSFIGLLASCEDELISSSYDRNPDQVEVFEDNTNDSAESDSTTNEQKLYPIGFTVDVENYSEYE